MALCHFKRNYEHLTAEKAKKDNGNVTDAGASQTAFRRGPSERVLRSSEGVWIWGRGGRR